MDTLDSREIVASLALELRRGTVVLCALGLLHKPMYGYEIVALLKESGLPVEANTLYPLLRRLEGQGLLESSWQTGGAKPRKYYVLTKLGAQVRDGLKARWDETVAGMERLWKEEDHGA